uniref:Uncharacterized protein n=1 Tax=Rhizophora mucronata TaxID=61149 RepID=A0A2P2ILY2_RHIMU
MKRANISGSKRASNLIGNSQARGNASCKHQPHHLCHPQSHGPRHCHRFLCAWVRGVAFTGEIQEPSYCFRGRENPIRAKLQFNSFVAIMSVTGEYK